MSFASVVIELRRDVLITLETHIVMSSLIFCLGLILVLRHYSFMNLTIAQMILVHERTTLCLDAVVTTHVLIVVTRRPSFPAGGSYTHFEPRQLDGPHFHHRGSCPTGSNGEVLKTVKTYSGRMVSGRIVKCWIPKIYLTNHSTEPSTSSCTM
jgi:hypothetical protein